MGGEGWAAVRQGREQRGKGWGGGEGGGAGREGDNVGPAGWHKNVVFALSALQQPVVLSTQVRLPNPF